MYMELDLTKVEFSEHDRNIGLKIPEQITTDLAEEIGIHIGDGSMNIYNNGQDNKYSLRGHSLDDVQYYENFINPLYRKLYNLNVRIRKWPDVIGFQVSSNALIQFKQKVGLPLGWKSNIKIPSIITKDERFLAACIRGVFDTDGCISFEKKPPTYSYPRIIITNTSKLLMFQLKKALIQIFGFNLSYWVSTHEEVNWKPTHRICIRGFKNIEKWKDLIGSNNPKNIKKLNEGGVDRIRG